MKCWFSFVWWNNIFLTCQFLATTKFFKLNFFVFWIVLLILKKLFCCLPLNQLKEAHLLPFFVRHSMHELVFYRRPPALSCTSLIAHCARGQNTAVPSTQSVVFAGAAGLRCVPSRCPAGWPAAPSSPSVTQGKQQNNRSVINYFKTSRGGALWSLHSIPNRLYF